MGWGTGFAVAALTYGGVVGALASAGGAGGQRPRGSICMLPYVERAKTDSGSCLACHDGSVGVSVGVPGSAPGGPGSDPNHPFEVSYEQGRMRLPSNTMPPASALPPSLPLVRGKLTCTTCHDGASPYPGRTAMPMDRSAMCFACHAY